MNTRKETLHWPASVRRAPLYTDWLSKHTEGVTSLLDIGAADGIVGKHLPESIRYSGIDIGADIYSRESNVTYIEDYDQLKKSVSDHDKVDTAIMLDVLEHTPEFTELFRLAATVAQKYVFVTLPNEMYLGTRLNFLRGLPVACHGLNMVGMKPGHKHLWLIKVADARDVLNKVAEPLGFEMAAEVHLLPKPKSAWKRSALSISASLLPPELCSVGFGFLYKKRV